MRKLFFFSSFLMFLALVASSQSYYHSDSVAERKFRVLQKSLHLVTGKTRIDYLNNIARGLYYIWEEDDSLRDSAIAYLKLAIAESNKIGYKVGLGYATAGMVLGEINKSEKRNDEHYKMAEEYAKKAIKISEQIDEPGIKAAVYDTYKWYEKWRSRDTSQHRFYLQKAIDAYELALKKYSKQDYQLLTFTECSDCNSFQFSLGSLYFEQAMLLPGYSEQKISGLQKALNYYRQANDRSGEGSSNLEIGNALLQNLDKTAAEYFKKAIPLFQSEFNEQGEVLAYTNLVSYYWNLGDFENGLIYANECMKLADRLATRYARTKEVSYQLGQAYFWTGRIYSIAGDNEAALNYMRKAIQFYPRWEQWTTHWSIGMGDLHRIAGNYDSALFYIEPYVKKGNVVAKLWLSNVYVTMQEYDKALPLINESLKTAEERRDRLYAGRSNANAARLYLAKNDLQKALQHALKAQSIFKTIGRNFELIDHYNLLSEIYYRVGKNDSAFIYLKKYTVQKDSLFNRQFYIRMNNYKKEAEEIKKTTMLKLLQQDNFIKQQQLQQQLMMHKQSEAQLALLDKDNEIKEQQLKLKEQQLSQESYIKKQKQSQLTLLDNENRLKDQRLSQQAFIRNALLGGLLLLFVLGVFIFRSLSLKRKNERLQSEKRQAELQQKASELEMQALRAQMNPHFIFNCLSSINKFILKNDTDAASDYLTRFSRLIRQSLTNSQLSLIPLSDEIEMLRLYLDMERLRFSDSFAYNITYENSIEPETVYVPPMLLQPFCENAIWHGLMHKEGAGKLEVVLSLEDGFLRCIVADNGVGRAKAAELKSKSRGKQKSFGLKITTERLALFNNEKSVHDFYKTEDVLDSNGDIAGTKVVLKLKIKNPVYEPAKEPV